MLVVLVFGDECNAMWGVGPDAFLDYEEKSLPHFYDYARKLGREAKVLF